MDEESKIPTAVLKEFLRIALQSAPTLLVMLSFDKADSEIRLNNKHSSQLHIQFLAVMIFIGVTPLPVASAYLSPFGGR